MQPLITVGLTTFNSLDTVDKAIASVLSQTWKPLEFIVIDDASDDGTYERLLELSLEIQALKLFRNVINYGIAVSRNRILSIAKGEFVAFFDDDDISLPCRIALQYERIVQYENEFELNAPVVCHTARKVIYPNGEVRIQNTMGQVKNRHAPFGERVAKRILMGYPLKDSFGACPTCSQMARLATYKLVGGFDPKLRRSEDTDFNIRLALSGGHFVGIKDPLVIQTMTPSSDKSLTDEYRNMLTIIKKNRNFIEKFGQYEFCLQWLYIKHVWFTRNFIIFLKVMLLIFIKYPLMTLRRIFFSFPNIMLNNAFSRFHLKVGYKGKINLEKKKK